MNLEHIKHLTIGDIIEIIPILKMSIKNARPLVLEFQKKHDIDYSGFANAAKVAKLLF